MQTVVLRSRLEMPIVGLGTWQMLDGEATQAVTKALEIGYRLIDTALVYKNDVAIGKALMDSTVPRKEIFVTTKLPSTTEDAENALRAHLEALQTDYVDLLLIHWPLGTAIAEELWQLFIDLQAQKLTKEIGLSNYSVAQMEQLYRVSGHTPAVNQVEWSPFGFDADMLAYCQQHNIILEAYSPLTQQQKLHDSRVERIAKKHHKTAAQILIRWNIERGVVVIPKAATSTHLKENLAVFDFSLDQHDMRLLDSCNEGFQVFS